MDGVSLVSKPLLEASATSPHSNVAPASSMPERKSLGFARPAPPSTLSGFVRPPPLPFVTGTPTPLAPPKPIPVPIDPRVPSARIGQFAAAREERRKLYGYDENSDGGFVPASPSGSDLSDGDPPGYGPVLQPNSIPRNPDLKRRSFEELEDITFSNPKNFASMAFEIATSRDTTLVVTDDRTHKVTSAYMHISCAYRRSGCPFILKLTKAKEGGWIIKSSRATDVDPKQRSMYRCRHPIGAIPDSQMPPPVPTVVDKNGVSGPKGKGVKGPKRKDGTSSATKGPAKKKKLSDDYEEGITVTPRIAPLSREPRPSAKARAARENSMMDEDEDYYDEPKITPYTLANPDRALAPPFERSQSLLNQISPALVPGSAEQSPYYPYADAAAFNSRSPQLHASSSRYGPTGAPVLPSFPDTLPHWTAFIALLDPALLELAPVLASPAVACSPDQFFAEDEDMRMDLIDGLPGNSIGVWPRLKFKKAIKDRGIEVWKVLEERKSGDLSDSVGTPSFYGPSGAKHGADGKRAHVISARPSWLPVLAGSTTPGGTPIVVTNPAIDPLARISTPSSGTSSPASGQPTTSSSLNKVIIGGTSGGKNGAAKAKKVVKVKKENPLPPRTKLQRKAVLANSGYDYDEEDSESSHSDSSSGEEEQDLSAYEEDGDDDSREPEDRKAVSRPSTIAGTVASKKAANIGSNIVVLPAVSSHPLRTVSPVIPSPSPSSSSMQPLSSASRRGPPDLIVAPAPFATSSSMVLDATRPPFVPSLPFATTPTPATVAGSPSVMRIPYIPVWKPNSS